MKNSKYRVAMLGIIIAVVATITATVALSPHTVDRSCVWCGRSPSIEYKTSTDHETYVCRDCRKVCAWCGERASKQTENLIHTRIIFLCKDCYKSAMND